MKFKQMKFKTVKVEDVTLNMEQWIIKNLLKDDIRDFLQLEYDQEDAERTAINCYLENHDEVEIPADLY